MAVPVRIHGQKEVLPVQTEFPDVEADVPIDFSNVRELGHYATRIDWQAIVRGPTPHQVAFSKIIPIHPVIETGKFDDAA